MPAGKQIVDYSRLPNSPELRAAFRSLETRVIEHAQYLDEFVKRDPSRGDIRLEVGIVPRILQSDPTVVGAFGQVNELAMLAEDGSLYRKTQTTGDDTNWLLIQAGAGGTPLTDHAHRHATSGSSLSDTGADPITPYDYTWTGWHLFQAAVASETPVTIQAQASQTGPLLEISDSSSVTLVRVDEEGRLGINVDPTADIHVRAEAAQSDNIVLIEANDQTLWWLTDEAGRIGVQDASPAARTSWKTSGFDPEDIGDMLFWFKADEGVTRSGSDVTGMEDHTGNGYDLTDNGDEDKPQYISSWSNGLPGIHLAAPSQAGFFLGQEVAIDNLTLFVVLQWDGTPLTGKNITLLHDDDGVGSEQAVGIDTPADSSTDVSISDTDPVSANDADWGSLDDDDPYAGFTVESPFILVITRGNTDVDWRAWADMEYLGFGTNTRTDWTTHFNDFAWANPISAPWKFGEVICYSKYLDPNTSQDMQNVCNYLAGKWGISGGSLSPDVGAGEDLLHVKNLGDTVQHIMQSDLRVGLGGASEDFDTTPVSLDAIVEVRGDNLLVTSDGAVGIEEVTADPSTVADHGFFYSKEVASQAEAFYLDDAGNAVQLTSGGGLAASLSSDTEILFNNAGLIDGVPTFTYSGSVLRQSDPLYLGDADTTGIIRVDKTDVGSSVPALRVEDTVDRSGEGSGQAAFIWRNTIESKDLMGFSTDGEFWFGKGTFFPQPRHVLSFVAGDSVNPVGKNPSVGILGYIQTILGTSETHDKLIGVHGHAQVGEDLSLNTNVVCGVRGTAGGGDDATGYSSKYLAGFMGSLGGDGNVASLQGDLDEPLLVGAGSVEEIPAGDWKMAAPFMASFITPSVAGGMPAASVANKPDIMCSFRAPIQGWSDTSGEQWAVYGDAPETGVPKTPDVGGFMRITYPRRATSHKMHLRFETTDTSAWPGGAKGDVKFDDGTTDTVGLYQHDGTAWRRLADSTNTWDRLTSTANDTTLVLTDDGSEQTLTGSLGQLNIVATGNLELVANGGSGAPLTLYNSGLVKFDKMEIAVDGDVTMGGNSLTVGGDGVALPTTLAFRTQSQSESVVLDDTSGVLTVSGPWQFDDDVGFYGTTPVSQPSAYTQTYATADKTLGAYTADDESGAYTGIDNAQAGTVYAQVSDLNALRTAYENLRAFAEDAAQMLNSLVDDCQTLGLVA